MTDRLKQVWTWLASREPLTYVLAGWIAFGLGSYPGFMSFDSIMQLFQVRSGIYTDAYPPVMTGIWSLLEWVASGPFPMLALQSGLFLFGLAAVLRTILTPRAAAITAVGILLFPPVFAVMAVIWPDALMAGALLAAAGALLDARRGWKIAGVAFLVLACACRPEIAPALIPFALLALPGMARWRRVALAVALVVGVAGTARLASWVLVDEPAYAWEQQLQMMDTIGTLRRAKAKNADAIAKFLEGTPIAVPGELKQRVTTGWDAFDYFPLANGPKRIFDPIKTDDQAAAMSAAWRRVIARYPKAYWRHRWSMTKQLLGFTPKWLPVFDGFGDPDLVAPLHFRASSSDCQEAWKTVVEATGKTPLMKPWLYLLLAIGALVLAWRTQQKLLRMIVASGLAYEVVLVFLARAPDYRYSHWLVTVTTAALAAMAVARRWSREPA